MLISGAIMVRDGTMSLVIGIWEDIKRNDRFFIDHFFRTCCIHFLVDYVSYWLDNEFIWKEKKW
jgi:hypothetical protein